MEGPDLLGVASAVAGAGPAAWLLPLLVLVVPLVGYARGVARWRAAARDWSGWRTASLAAGVLLLALALSPPVASFAHADARGHMLQHLLLGMFAPLGLVLAAPVTLLLGALPVASRRPVASLLQRRGVHVATHPVTAAVLNVGGLSVLYLTPLYAVSTNHPAVHHLVSLHFVLAGCLYTWALAGPDPAPGRPSMAVRVAVLVVSAGAHAFLAKLLYARAPALPPGAHGDAEQLRAAAQWMYYGGDVAEALLAAAVFAAWYRRRRTRPAAVRSARAAPTA